MHITGTFEEPQFTADGRARLVISVNETSKALEEMQSLKGSKLAIDIQKFREKRSLDANAYFWQLVDKIGKVLGSDKWTVYLLQLSKWGVFTDLEIKQIALETLQKHFRYTEILNESGEYISVRCYYGSSEYDSKEMSDLINGTVQDANDLGIDTLTPDEISRMLSAWKEKR